MIQNNLILFDGVCNLCCGWVHFLIRRDRHEIFKFASLQSDSGKRIAESIGINSQNIQTVIYVKTNQYFTESSAILEILKDLGGVWKLFLIFKLIPKSLRDSLYRLIAEKRYKLFGKKAVCITPTQELQKRFLL
jgi:predicted DCC family thiol-disulfide oxidoreductase YuxK